MFFTNFTVFVPSPTLLGGFWSNEDDPMSPPPSPPPPSPPYPTSPPSPPVPFSSSLKLKSFFVGVCDTTLTHQGIWGATNSTTIISNKRYN